ncbi:MAG: HU family DNA-binding protein [Firmicutes bacterium]|nr:HU family DNA-binding protein [Bacillota bacterium]
MTKNDIIDAVADHCGITKKDTETVINALGEEIKAALKRGDDVRFIGFGTFEVKERAERKGRNPKTGEELTIPPTKVPVFKCGKLLKSAVNE